MFVCRRRRRCRFKAIKTELHWLDNVKRVKTSCVISFNITNIITQPTLKVAGISHDGCQCLQLVQCRHGFALFHLWFTHFA